MSEDISAARADLAPTGTLHVGINFANILLTARDPVTRAPSGVALDLAHEFGKRLGVPVKILHYESAGGRAEAAAKGAQARERDHLHRSVRRNRSDLSRAARFGVQVRR